MVKKTELFFSMLKTGLFTFGGGYAMIALLEHEFVTKKKWLEKEEFLDMAAVAESTPGPIAINAATYIGYRTAGVAGSVLATAAVCIPSFVIIYVISLFLDAFLSLKLVSYAFKGIQVCVIYLIFTAGLRLLKDMKKTFFSVFTVCAVCACMITFSLFSVKFSSVFFVLICGAAGVFIYLVNALRSRGGEEDGK